MKYPKLKENSICLNCIGCSLLEITNFYGRTKCNTFKDGYTDQEKADKLKEEKENTNNIYGSSVGVN